MVTEKTPPSKRKTRSSNKKEITIERYEYLSKINNEYFELLSKYNKEQEMMIKLLKENNQCLKDLKFFKEMYHAQLSNILQ